MTSTPRSSASDALIPCPREKSGSRSFRKKYCRFTQLGSRVMVRLQDSKSLESWQVFSCFKIWTKLIGPKGFSLTPIASSQGITYGNNTPVSSTNEEAPPTFQPIAIHWSG